MNYRELLEKYNLLLSENRRLIEENDRLKAQLGKAERNMVVPKKASCASKALTSRMS
jgi:regulator of replication initiation timing